MNNSFTVVGDPHITSKSLDKANKLFDEVEVLGLPVIWMGDFLDTKEVIRGKCLNLLYARIAASKLHHYIIIGNHDWFNLECLDHSLQVLKSLPNVTIIDKPTQILPDTVALPYIHDKAQAKDIVDALKTAGIKSLFGHFDVVGFDYGNGHASESGLSHADFEGYESVISGHYHKLQQTGNLTYIGTPFSHSFGEANQDKVLGIWNSETKQLQLIPTKFPRHVSKDFHLEKKNAADKIGQFVDENAGNLVRVRLFGQPDEVIKFDKSKWANLNVKWEDKSEGSLDSDIDVDESLDNKSQFMAWARDIKGLDEETLNIGLGILEALNVK